MRRALAIAALCLVSAACTRGGDDRLPPGATPTPRPTPTPIVSKENQLPAGFPADLPLPDDRKVVYSVKQGPTLLVFFDSAQPRDALSAFFKTRLNQGGWRIRQCVESPKQTPEPLTTIQAVKGTTLAAVVVGFIDFPEENQADLEPPDRYSFFVTAQTESAQQTPLSSPATC